MEYAIVNYHIDFLRNFVEKNQFEYDEQLLINTQLNDLFDYSYTEGPELS